MDLATRNTQATVLEPRVRTSLTAALVTILRTKLSTAATDQDKKVLRVKQAWAASHVADPDLVTKVALMVASAAPDAKLDAVGGLADTDVTTYVGIAVEALAAVEYNAPDATVPA